jgi:large subunit ribosomal protein L1
VSKKRGKKYLDIIKQYDFSKVYSPEEALNLVLKTNTAKFTETVEIAIKLGVDPRHADQQVRGTVILPNGTGKELKILVITQGENEAKAQAAGADYVGADEYIEKIKNGWFEFDLVIATPDMMPKLGRLGKILGTKGLMPNPKSGTVTTDVAKTVEEFKKGKLAFKIDKLGSLHAPLGKANFEENKVVENFKAFLKEVIRLKPTSSKGQYLRTIALSLTMGPGVKIDPILAQKFIEE